MSRGKPPAPPIPISSRQYQILEKEESKQTIAHQYKIRFGIILGASTGKSNSQLKRDLKISLNTVKRWRNRWTLAWESLNIYESGTNSKPTKDYELLNRMKEILSDKPRSGTPKRITMSQEQQILALACEKPEKYGIAMTHWNRDMLAKVAIKQGVIEKVSPRYISVILKKTI